MTYSNDKNGTINYVDCLGNIYILTEAISNHILFSIVKAILNIYIMYIYCTQMLFYGKNDKMYINKKYKQDLCFCLLKHFQAKNNYMHNSTT